MIRPWFGVSGLTVNKEVAAYYNLPVNSGVLVAEVMRDSPAEKAGIIPGDVIQSFSGFTIRGVENLQKAIHNEKAGVKIKIVIIRDNHKWTVETTLDKMP